jgi:hypothetical protein
MIHRENQGTNQLRVNVLPVFNRHLVITLLCSAIISIEAAAAPEQAKHTTDSGIHIELSPRTPDQIASFYEARGFPRQMIEVLRQQCFFTVRLLNRRDEIVWLELSNWAFSHEGKPLHRPHRDAWQQRWQNMNMPMASRATFRWTLLPETLDYLPDEEEGGNIILPRVQGDIQLHAVFKTGQNKLGPQLEMDFTMLNCAASP